MSDEIGVGDRFLIEVEVAELPRPSIDPCCEVHITGTGDEYDLTIPIHALLSGNRLPRQIKVGDRVTGYPHNAPRGVSKWRVVAIDGDLAAVAGLPPNEVAHNWIALGCLAPLRQGLSDGPA